jgi:hypothetical protein
VKISIVADTIAAGISAFSAKPSQLPRGQNISDEVATKAELEEGICRR